MKNSNLSRITSSASKVTTSALITILMVALMVVIAPTTVANSTVKKVPDDYLTIQAAVNAAAPGDTIEVSGQTYYENLFVNKAVRLVGENPQTTIIDGGEKDTVVYVYADNVYITGFTIRNSSSDFNSGIHIGFFTKVVIVGNIITNNEFGVWLEDARNSVVSDNEITHSAKDAVYLGNSTSNSISRNIMINNTYGVWLERYSNYNIIQGNTITNSSKGIRLSGNSNNNAVYDNTLKDNEDGVDLSSSFNTIYENTLRSNFHGIYSPSTSDVGNVLYRNNFIDNTEHVSILRASLVEAWDNGFEGNHWSDYTGNDLNGDGIGDTDLPHRGFDWHPLIKPWSPFRIFNVTSNGENYIVTTLSNSTIASFHFNKTLALIGFNATGQFRTLGFCNITIPKALLKSEPPTNWTITVDDVFVRFTLIENSTHTSLRFAYAHSTHKIKIKVMQIENFYPITDFTYSPMNPTLYDTVNFTDLSTDSDGYIVSWRWEFGDGNNSTEQNPKYKYLNGGHFVVTLTVEDNSTAKTATSKMIYVRKLRTTLAIDAPSTANRGNTINVITTLKDEKENFVPNATVGLYLFRQEEWESIGSNKTSAGGAASISYTPLLAVGTYQFKAEFNGTQILAESNIIFTIEIKEVTEADGRLQWWFILISLALVAAVVFAAILIRRKRRASKNKTPFELHTKNA